MSKQLHDTEAHLAAGALSLPAPGCPDCPEPFTRRDHLTHQLAVAGDVADVAGQTVSSTTAEHPEWDMEEMLTTKEWNGR